jgi:hypothetical protein
MNNKIVCPKCGCEANELDHYLEDEDLYGCFECNLWFAIHKEPLTYLLKELESEGIIQRL